MSLLLNSQVFTWSRVHQCSADNPTTALTSYLQSSFQMFSHCIMTIWTICSYVSILSCDLNILFALSNQSQSEARVVGNKSKIDNGTPHRDWELDVWVVNGNIPDNQITLTLLTRPRTTCQQYSSSSDSFFPDQIQWSSKCLPPKLFSTNNKICEKFVCTTENFYILELRFCLVVSIKIILNLDYL